jgi:hypothetical protein
LLSLEHASCKGILVLGYVLNDLQGEPSLAADTNREALFSLTSVPCLGELSCDSGLNGRMAAIGERLDTSFLATLLPRG